MSRQFTFGRKERLKSRKQIDSLFSSGKKIVMPPFRVHYLINNIKDHSLQFGIGVSSRVFKKAVDRNRVKRIARECWRLQKSVLQQQLLESGKQMHVFVIYTAKEPPVFQELMPVMEKLINKLRTQIGKP